MSALPRPLLAYDRVAANRRNTRILLVTFGVIAFPVAAWVITYLAHVLWMVAGMPDAFQATDFVDAIDSAYRESDLDRGILERALDQAVVLRTLVGREVKSRPIRASRTAQRQEASKLRAPTSEPLTRYSNRVSLLMDLDVASC